VRRRLDGEAEESLWEYYQAARAAL
jgi:hypothetical protein